LALAPGSAGISFVFPTKIVSGIFQRSGNPLVRAYEPAKKYQEVDPYADPKTDIQNHEKASDDRHM